MILMALIIKLFLKLRILKVNICDSWSVYHILWLVNTELIFTYREFLELHNVLRQGTSLVTKYVMNHSKLLIQVWWLNFAWQVITFLINSNIPGNKFGLNEINHFESHK